MNIIEEIAKLIYQKPSDAMEAIGEHGVLEDAIYEIKSLREGLETLIDMIKDIDPVTKKHQNQFNDLINRARIILGNVTEDYFYKNEDGFLTGPKLLKLNEYDLRTRLYVHSESKYEDGVLKIDTMKMPF